MLVKALVINLLRFNECEGRVIWKGGIGEWCIGLEKTRKVKRSK